MVKIPEWYRPISQWPDAVAEAANISIDPIESRLIIQLANSILFRWKSEAAKFPNSEVEFERLYKVNERNAKAAIVAILEMIKFVGEGKSLLSQYEGFLKK